MVLWSLTELILRLAEAGCRETDLRLQLLWGWLNVLDKLVLLWLRWRLLDQWRGERAIKGWEDILLELIVAVEELRRLSQLILDRSLLMWSPLLLLLCCGEIGNEIGLGVMLLVLRGRCSEVLHLSSTWLGERLLSGLRK